MKTARITGYFLVVYVVNHVVKLFPILFFIERYIYKFPTSLLKKKHCNVIHSRENRFFSFKEDAAITHDTVVVETF